jgi:putative ABC transport system ATP-binding protein
MDGGVVLDAVTKQYRTGPATSSVLSEVSLMIPAGQFVSVMGPSGSGKSTLLNLIAGLDTPNAGRVLVGGHDLATLSDDARSDLRLRHIATVFQSFNLFPTFTVEENVLCPLEFLGVRAREGIARAHAALDHVGLDASVRGRRPSELSGGEQQRIAIARALVVKPQLLLADEPTGSLDSLTAQLILDLLRRFNREYSLTVVLVTHNVLAATYGHRTVELRDGRVVHDVEAPRPITARVVPLRE